jgi:hypothetical protein
VEKVTDILNDPIVRAGLAVASPEVALGIELVLGVTEALFGPKPPTVSMLLAVIDKQLADLLSELATNPSHLRKKELEIRTHELLRLLNNWGKIS